MFKLHIGRRIEFCIRFAARRGWTSEAGGPKCPLDVEDWFTTVFLCSIWNCKRCSSTIRRDNSWHIAKPQVRQTFLPDRGIWATSWDGKWQSSLHYRVFCRWLYFSSYLYITGKIESCGKCGHEWHSWRLISRRGWLEGLNIAEEAQKIGGTIEPRKKVLGFHFDGINKTIWLAAEKRVALLLTQSKWIQGAN